MIDWNWLGVVRRHSVFIAGSVFFGKRSPSDVDMIVGVAPEQIPAVENSLVNSGFRLTEPTELNPETTDHRILSGFKADYMGKPDYFDVQIATPAVAAARLKAMKRIKKHKMHFDADKKRLYQLYDEFADVAGF